MTESNPNPEAAEAPRRRGILGFLFKTTLGCASFALGVFIVLILLLPTLLSGFAARTAASAFNGLYQGRLEIASLDLAWFSTQTVRDARVVDPAGVEVARASITLPSLWSLSSFKSGHIGTIVVDVQADLVADDAGVTNLQRALAPRDAREETNESDSKSSDSSFDAGEFARRLDLDLRVNLQRVTWSDAETRRVGTPFEINGGVLTATAKPGQPIAVHVGGNIAGDAAGVLEIDATVHGPIDMNKTWPLGRTVAKGRVERFSTAMVDGIAGLAGDLVEVLGPHFTLRFDATAESAERGELDFTLDGALAGLALHAQLADGRITSIEKPFLVASAPFPRKIIERIAGSKLPPDAKLVLTDVGQPWTARISRLNVLLPKSGATDLAALQPALADAEIVMDVELPGSVVLESDMLRAANISAGISEMKLTARAAPGKPLVAHFEAALDAGAPGSLRLDATVPSAFAMLAGGPIPPVDLDARIDGLSTLALGEFAGQGARIAAALGPVASVTVEARQVNLEGGNARLVVTSAQLDANVAAKIAQGVLTMDAAAPTRITWTPSPEFVTAEIAPHLPVESTVAFSGPATVTIRTLSVPIRDAASGAFPALDALLAGLTAKIDVKLPQVAWSAGGTAAGAPAELREAQVTFEVAAGAPPVVRVAADIALDPSAVAKLEVDARPVETLARLATGAKPTGTAHLKFTGLDARALERLAGQPDQIAPLFGPTLDLVVNADGALPTAGSIALELKGATGNVRLAGRVADAQFVAKDKEGLDASFQVTPELLAAKLGPSLPAGTRVELSGTGPSAITVSVRDFATPLEAPDVARRLAGTSAKLEVVLPAIAYADAKTDAAKRAVVLSGARLSAALSPTEKPSLRFSAKVEDTPPGELALDLTALDPLEKLQGDAAWKTFRASARVHAENVPTALVDALAGQDGLLVEALGPRIAIDAQAPDIAFDHGYVEALVESGKNRVAITAHLDNGTLVIDKADGLDVDVALGPLVMDRVVGSLLPMLKKASFLASVEKQDVVSTAEFAPFLLKSSAVRFLLGGDLTKLNGVFRIDLGTLSFQGLPMLEQLGVSLDAADVRLPAFTVPIRDGVAYYEKLPIRIAGRDVLFDGNVRLTDGEMSLATSLPLSLLGKSITRELDKVREFLPADTAVPVELRGTWNKPRLAFKDGFVSDMLKKAGQNAVEKATKDGLDGLLDGLLGGKKKKKDG